MPAGPILDLDDPGIRIKSDFAREAIFDPLLRDRLITKTSHEGAIRRDPIAVRLDDMRVALRRRDAEDVWVLLDAE